MGTRKKSDTNETSLKMGSPSTMSLGNEAAHLNQVPNFMTMGPIFSTPPATTASLNNNASEARTILSVPSQMVSNPVAQHAANSAPSSGRPRNKLGHAASKTSSFFANLHPARWARWGSNVSALPGSSNHMSAGRNSSGLVTISSSHLTPASVTSSPRSPNSNGNREKIKTWVKEQAVEFEEKYFSNIQDSGPFVGGDSHPALDVLNRLQEASEIFDNKDASLALQELKSVLMEGDISPFELIHSGIVSKVLHYLAKSDDVKESERQARVRTFLSVFMGTPAHGAVWGRDEPIGMSMEPTPLCSLVSKLNACVSQLEQFPVRVHDVVGTGSGSIRGTSALKFFNTHQLKCNLQRHPSCANLKQWRGGPVKIDPLALVQAIERYLVIRGYGRVREDDEEASDEDNSDEEFDDNMAAMMLSQGQGRHKLQFWMGENLLPYNMTVYQAIRQFGSAVSGNDGHDTDTDSEALMGHANMWVQTHTIYYKPYQEGLTSTTSSGLSSASSCFSAKGVVASQSVSSTTSRRGSSSKGSSGKNSSPKRKDELWTDGKVPTPTSPVDEFLEARLPSSVTIQDASLEVINLLRLIHGLSRHWGWFYSLSQPYKYAIAPSEFVNSKLTAKANRQLQDPLVIMTGNLPTWLSQIAYACPFLFPFETRHLLFYATCFDRDRALQRLLDTTPGLNSSDSSERVTPRLDRRKRTVSRDDLLKQAETVLHDCGNSKALLEIQYINEVGTGLGPTLEFYALVSKEMQRSDLDLWRGEAVDSPDAAIQTSATPSKSVIASSSSKEIQATEPQNKPKDKQDVKYMYSPRGLFPQPFGRGSKAGALSKVKSRYKLLGKFLAKALMDSRMVWSHLTVSSTCF